MDVNVSLSLLITSVGTLCCFIIPGFILRKFKLAGDSFAKNLSVFVLYVAQGPLLIHGFISEFDKSVFWGICQVFLFGIAAHAIFYVVAMQLFKKAPAAIRSVLRFGIIFSNAGYIGIPIIGDVFGAEYTIYATVYVVCFNLFAFTLGRMIYTNDKKYISVREAIVNPAVIPIIIGLILYITHIGGWIKASAEEATVIGKLMAVLINVITILKNTITPISMVIIGVHLADVDFKGIFKDKYLYPFIFIKLIGFPVMLWLIMKPLTMLNVLSPVVMAITLILASAPSAAFTSVFAELYGGDAPYSGKLVSITSVLSIVTIPAVALLLNI